MRQIFRYAFGRLETSSDEETIHQLFATFRDSSFHFKDLLIGLVRSPEFMAGLEDNQKGVTRSPGSSVSSENASSKSQRGEKNANR